MEDTLTCLKLYVKNGQGKLSLVFGVKNFNILTYCIYNID